MSKLHDMLTKLKNTEVNADLVKSLFKKGSKSEVRLPFGAQNDASQAQDANAEANIGEGSSKPFRSNIEMLSQLKSFSIKDLRNINLKEFYTTYKQQILTIFLIVIGIFFLFYWTNAIISYNVENLNKAANATYQKLGKAVDMQQALRQAGSKASNVLSQSLLVFLQETGTKLDISNKITNLRPVASLGGTKKANQIEHVSLRLENAYYDEFVRFIAALEKYTNVSIKVLSFNRRYDDPMMIDSSIEVVKQ